MKRQYRLGIILLSGIFLIFFGSKTEKSIQSSGSEQDMQVPAPSAWNDPVNDYVDEWVGTEWGTTTDFQNMTRDDETTARLTESQQPSPPYWWISQTYRFNDIAYGYYENETLMVDVASAAYIYLYVWIGTTNVGVIDHLGLNQIDIHTYLTAGSLDIKLTDGSDNGNRGPYNLKRMYLFLNNSNDHNKPTFNSASLPSQGGWYSSNPSLNFQIQDNVLLDDGWWDVDDATPDQALFTNRGSYLYSNPSWTMDAGVWDSLAQGSHTIYWAANDSVGNIEGESGEWSWQFYKDSLIPNTPNATCTSHLFSTWSTDDTIDVQWVDPGDNGGYGVNGYSYSWTHGMATPDTTFDTAGMSITSSPLGEGNDWYFNIRARDGMNFWSGTNSTGPFFIDNNPPVITPVEDFYYFENSTGHYINWSVSDGFPLNYTIYNNSIAIKTDTWTSPAEISVCIDGLTNATYNYTLVVQDVIGNVVSNEVNVTVIDDLIPTITPLENCSFAIFTTSHVLQWNITDPDILDGTYDIYVNEIINQSGSWISGENVTLTMDGWFLGTYNITINASDGWGAWVRDEVFLTVYDTPTTITGPGNIAYIIGTQNHNITWTLEDPDITSTTYIIFFNSVENGTGGWIDGQKIVINLDPLPWGIYNYTLFSSDGLGFVLYDQVIVTVNNNVPAINHPADSDYLFNTLGHTIVWTISDPTVNHTRYEIYRNNDMYLIGAWTSDISIPITIDGLAIGTYNYTIIITDGYGAVVQDTVMITVKSDTGGAQKNWWELDWLWGAIGAVGGIAIAILPKIIKKVKARRNPTAPDAKGALNEGKQPKS